MNTLDGNTSGAINAVSINTLTGTAAEITTVYSSSGISGLGNEAVTVTGADYTVAQLKANNATTGAIVLVVPSLDLTGTAADLYQPLLEQLLHILVISQSQIYLPMNSLP